MTSATQVSLCGPLIAEIDGRRAEAALPGHKGRLLFASLIVGRGTPIARDELIETIWAERPPVDPDAAFSTLLTRLRSALGPGVVEGRGELTLVLDADAWIDWEVAQCSAAAAERHLVACDARAALDSAVAGLEIVRRPFLPDVGRQTTRWVEERRQELRDLHSALLEAAGRSALSLGGEQLPAAERSARELADREPYRESAYALLMEAHVARGNVAEALRVYDELRQRLRAELGLTPAEAVTRLATRLLEQPAVASVAHTTPAPVAPDVPRAAGPGSGATSVVSAQLRLPVGLKAAGRGELVGRRQELRRLVDAGSGVVNGGGRAFVFTGEAGVGKTRLAAEVAVRARRSGFDVLHGRAERSGVTPYQPFVDAIRRALSDRPAAGRAVDASLAPELSELARLVPELRAIVPLPDGPTEPEFRQHRVFTAVTALLGALTRERPVLLVLDDLQWADGPTLLLFRHTVRIAHAERLLVIATVRNDEPLAHELREVVHELCVEGSLDPLAVNGVNREEATALMAADATGGMAERLWQETGGNPYLIRQFTGSIDDDIPVAICDAVDARLLRLSMTARSAVVAAARSGRIFDIAQVSACSGVPEHEVAAALGEAMRVGLIARASGQPRQLAFRHPVFRRALLAGRSNAWDCDGVRAVTAAA